MQAGTEAGTVESRTLENFPDGLVRSHKWAPPLCARKEPLVSLSSGGRGLESFYQARSQRHVALGMRLRAPVDLRLGTDTNAPVSEVHIADLCVQDLLVPQASLGSQKQDQVVGRCGESDEPIDLLDRKCGRKFLGLAQQTNSHREPIKLTGRHGVVERRAKDSQGPVHRWPRYPLSQAVPHEGIDVGSRESCCIGNTGSCDQAAQMLDVSLGIEARSRLSPKPQGCHVRLEDVREKGRLTGAQLGLPEIPEHGFGLRLTPYDTPNPLTVDVEVHRPAVIGFLAIDPAAEQAGIV